MKNVIYLSYLKNDFGELVLGSYGDDLCLCDWKYRLMRREIDSRILKGLKSDFVNQETEVVKKAKTELSQYFEGSRSSFDTPIILVGTEFQKLVWNALLNIEYGTTSSYHELSVMIGKPDAVRAVATANGANALSIFVPCHRIIGSNGDLVGYAGGLPTKKKLLRLEQTRFQHELF